MNIKPVEVSSVKKGANRKKFFLIKEMMDMEQLVELLKEIQLENEEKVDTVFKELSDKAKEAVKSVLKILVAYQDELPSDLLKRLADLLGYGYPEYPAPEVKASAEEVKPEVKPEAKPEEKSELPPELQSKLESLWKEREDLKKALDEEREKRIQKEYLEKAQEFRYVPDSQENIANLLRALDEKVPELKDTIFKVLNSYREAVNQAGILKEFGNDTSIGFSAWSKVEAMANSLIEKDSTMTKPMAIEKILKEHPELYEQYLQEVNH